MFKYLKFFVVVLLTTFCVSLTSCSDSDDEASEDSLVGTWHLDKKATYEAWGSDDWEDIVLYVEKNNAFRLEYWAKDDSMKEPIIESFTIGTYTLFGELQSGATMHCVGRETIYYYDEDGGYSEQVDDEPYEFELKNIKKNGKKMTCLLFGDPAFFYKTK